MSSSDTSGPLHHSTLRSTNTNSFETRTRHASSTIGASMTTRNTVIETTASASSSIQSTSSLAVSETPESKLPIAAIAGGAAGGGAGLLLLLGLLIYYILHARKSRNQHCDEVVQRLSNLPSKVDKRNSPDQSGPKEAPLMHSSPNPYHAYSYDHSSVSTLANQHFEPPTAHPPNASLADKHLAQRRLSELSGETAIRSEGDGSWSSPKLYSTSQSPPNTVLGSPRWDSCAHSRQNSGQVMWAEGGQWAQQPAKGYHVV